MSVADKTQTFNIIDYLGSDSTVMVPFFMQPNKEIIQVLIPYKTTDYHIEGYLYGDIYAYFDNGFSNQVFQTTIAPHQILYILINYNGGTYGSVELTVYGSAFNDSIVVNAASGGEYCGFHANPTITVAGNATNQIIVDSSSDSFPIIFNTGSNLIWYIQGANGATLSNTGGNYTATFGKGNQFSLLTNTPINSQYLPQAYNGWSVQYNASPGTYNLQFATCYPPGPNQSNTDGGNTSNGPLIANIQVVVNPPPAPISIIST